MLPVGANSEELMQGSKLTKNSSRNFATGYLNLVAIKQLLVAELVVAESSRCILLSAV